MLVLEREFPQWRMCRVFECAPGGPASAKLARECSGYISARWLPGFPLGEMVDGLRNENLQSLSFPDESHDVVITQDVLEHVLCPELAFAEIARVLRRGGAHVFTVPLYPRDRTVIRAVAGSDDDIRYLVEPDYHIDPYDPAGTLVVREWGADLRDFILDSSGLETSIFTKNSRRYGLRGEFLDVMVSRKTD